MAGHWDTDGINDWWVNTDGKSPKPENTRAANVRPGHGPYAGMGIPKGEQRQKMEAREAAQREKIRKENEAARKRKEWEDAQPKSYHYRKAAEEHENAAGFWEWAKQWATGARADAAQAEAERNRRYASNARNVADEDERQRQAAYERTQEGQARVRQEQAKRTQVSEADKAFANWRARVDGMSNDQAKREYWKFAKSHHPDRQRQDRREFGEEMMKLAHQYLRGRGIKA